MKISSAADSVLASVAWKSRPSKAGWPVRFGWTSVTGLPGAARSGDRADLEVGVPGEQPQQLAARVAAGARHRDPYAHDQPPRFLKKYAFYCMNMQHEIAGEAARRADTGLALHGTTSAIQWHHL